MALPQITCISKCDATDFKGDNSCIPLKRENFTFIYFFLYCTTLLQITCISELIIFILCILYFNEFICRTSYYTGDMDLFGKYTNGMDTTSPSSPPRVYVPTSDIRKVVFWINFNVSDYKECILKIY